MNLPTAKQNVCVKSYVLGINTCPYRHARKRELENTCKPDVCCALEAQCTCMRVLREHCQQKTSVSRILYSVYLKICFHLFSFNLKLISVDIFQSCSIKKSRTFKDQKPISRTFKAFKLDSRNSRVFKGFHDVCKPCVCVCVCVYQFQKC